MKNLLQQAWHLPWEMNNAPHALLDIIRGCNIKCVACYNNDKPKYKSLEEIKNDYYKILKLRKISAIALIGGEPLLHPELFDIIKFLKQQNLKIELFTNGLLLDKALCKKLAVSGVDLIFLHIDYGQKRPDLINNNSSQSINDLRTEKAMMIYEAGMESAISMTFRKSQMNIFMENVNYFISSPFINYFLITLYRNTYSIGKLKGDLLNDITGEFKLASKLEEVNINEILDILNQNKFKPYCYLGGRINNNVPRWISFVTACGFKNMEFKNQLQLSISNFEKKYIDFYKKRYGVYPFFNPQNCTINLIQIFLNGICSKNLLNNIKFLFKTFYQTKLIKRLLIQAPAEILDNNKIEHCECCPDLTVHKGKLVPVCICDNFD